MPDGVPLSTASGVQEQLPVVELAGGPGVCSLQAAGHNVNPVQARLASEQVGTRGRLIRTETGIVLRPLDGGDDIELRCHRPAALEEVLERYGSDGWRLSQSLLLNDRGAGVSVAAGSSKLTPCRSFDKTPDKDDRR